MLDLEPRTVALLLMVCVVLVFLPVGYVYPSRTTACRDVTLALTAVWMVSYAVPGGQLPSPSVVWRGCSLVYVLYYVALSLYLTARRRQARSRPGVDQAVT